jgi:hypothetical protein
VPLILLAALIPLIAIGLTPWLLIQRFRTGSARRPARRWMVVLAIISTALSVALLLIGAAVTNIWVSYTVRDSALGVTFGCLLGLAGLALTKWEPTPRSLHYTPNAALVLFVTLIISARVLFGIYRTITAARSGLSGGQLIGAFGVAESLGAGALVLGYYLAYHAGVLWKIRRWEQRPLRRA